MPSKYITIQTVDEALREKVEAFLKTHPRIPSISALAKVGLEQYIELANKYGIDANWQIQLPQKDDDSAQTR